LSDAVSNDEFFPGEPVEPLTAVDAFDVMRLFLENWWKRSGSPNHSVFDMGDVQWILSACDREIWAGGMPMDPAMWQDWREAIDQLRSGMRPAGGLTPP